MRLAIHGAPGMSELCDAKRRIETAAASDESVTRVEVSGRGERRIVVDFDAEKLSAFGIATVSTGRSGEGFEHGGGRALEVVIHSASPTTPEATAGLVEGWLEGAGIPVYVPD